MFRVGFAALDGRSEYTQIIQDSVERAAQEYDDIQLMVLDNQHCDATTIENAQAFMEWGADLVIMHHRNARILGDVRSLLFPVPIISVNIPVPLVTYFGANNRKLGILAADALLCWIEENWAGEVDHVIALQDQQAIGILDNRLDHTLTPLSNALRTQRTHFSQLTIPYDFKIAKHQILHYFDQLPPAQQVAVISAEPMLTEAIIQVSHYIEQPLVVVGHGVSDSLRDALAMPSPLIAATDCQPQHYGSALMQLVYRRLCGAPIIGNTYVDVKMMRHALVF